MPRWRRLLRLHRAALVLWCCFLLRGAFYCAFLPLWEGYDEWSHFGVIQSLAQSGRLLADRYSRVSREIQGSLETGPVPWEMRAQAAPALTEDDWWRLPERERRVREQALRALPPEWASLPSTSGLQIYEALQPPAYYWLSALPHRLLRSTSLLNRVYALRFFSLLLASFTVPIVYWVAFETAGPALATLSAALTVLLPELAIDVCRIGNECVGIVLFSALMLLAVRLVREAGWRAAAAVGVALGLGLLTKAYFLTAVPAVAMVWAFLLRRSEEKTRVVRQAGLTFALAFAIAGWWYLHNRFTTGTWSGLNESVMLRHNGAREMLAGVFEVRWLAALDSILLSHIWFGDWSSLQVRSWMYHVLFGVAAVAAVSLLRWLVRGRPETRVAGSVLLLFYGWFWVGQLYNVLLLFLSKGASTSMGWYLYAVIAAEAVLTIWGLSVLSIRLRFLPAVALVALIAALDFYTVHFVSIPYYTGLIAHRPSGPLAAFHVSRLNSIGFTGVFERLAVNKPLWLSPASLAVLWLLYLAGTAGAVWSAVRCVRRPV